MTDTARPDGGRAALAGFVTNRLGRATPRPAPAKAASPVGKSAAQNFENLPGYRELKLQRQAADLIGLGNPFFRVHDAKAGATTRIDQKSFTNFSSYDYLGLNGHPRVSNAAREAIDAYGTSASASRVVAGERPGHISLEQALAKHYRSEGCVVMVSGHATNVDHHRRPAGSRRPDLPRRAVPQQHRDRRAAFGRPAPLLRAQRSRRPGEPAPGRPATSTAGR